MDQPAESKRQWFPFAAGAIVAFGVGVGLFLVTSKSGPSSATEEATGGATGGAVAVIAALCAVGAARRRSKK